MDTYCSCGTIPEASADMGVAMGVMGAVMGVIGFPVIGVTGATEGLDG